MRKELRGVRAVLLASAAISCFLLSLAPPTTFSLPSKTTLSCPASITFGSTFTCTAQVGGGLRGPAGVVDFYTMSAGDLTNYHNCILSPSFSCTVTFSDTLGDVGGGCNIQIIGVYQGSGGIAPSGSAPSVVTVSDCSLGGVTTLTTLSCSPLYGTLNSPDTCTATVSGFAGDITGQELHFSNTAFAPSSGTFSASTCTISGASCSVEFTPESLGVAILSAAYTGAGDTNGNSFSVGAYVLTVSLRTTSTAVNCAKAINKGVPITCQVVVTDTGPGAYVTPSGAVGFSTNAPGTFSSTHCNLSGSGKTGTCSVTFTPAKSGFYNIFASYSGDASHSGSGGRTKSFFVP